MNLKEWRVYKIKTNAYNDATNTYYWVNPNDPNNNQEDKSKQFFRRSSSPKERETIFVKELSNFSNGDKLLLIAQLNGTAPDDVPAIDMKKLLQTSASLPKDLYGFIIPQNVRLALQSEFETKRAISFGIRGKVKEGVFDVLDNSLKELEQYSGRDKLIEKATSGTYDELSAEQLRILISVKQFNAKELTNKFEFDHTLLPFKDNNLVEVPLDLYLSDKRTYQLVDNIKKNHLHSLFPFETPLITKNGQELYSYKTKQILKYNPNMDEAVEVNPNNKTKVKSNTNNSGHNNEPEEA